MNNELRDNKYELYEQLWRQLIGQLDKEFSELLWQQIFRQLCDEFHGMNNNRGILREELKNE